MERLGRAGPTGATAGPEHCCLALCGLLVSQRSKVLSVCYLQRTMYFYTSNLQRFVTSILQCIKSVCKSTYPQTINDMCSDVILLITDLSAFSTARSHSGITRRCEISMVWCCSITMECRVARVVIACNDCSVTIDISVTCHQCRITMQSVAGADAAVPRPADCLLCRVGHQSAHTARRLLLFDGRKCRNDPAQRHLVHAAGIPIHAPSPTLITVCG